MAVRSSMAALITRVRLLINDPEGGSAVFANQDVQDVLDESRLEMRNVALTPSETFSGSSIQYLDYYSDMGGWEDDYVLKQFLTVPVTPSSVEPIAGHFVFAATMLPPVSITGKLYDVYRAAADLLERWSARWTLAYGMSVDGQSLQRQQVAPALQTLAKTYRMKQRPRSLGVTRGDLNMRHGGSTAHGDPGGGGLSLAPTELDYMAKG